MKHFRRACRRVPEQNKVFSTVAGYQVLAVQGVSLILQILETFERDFPCAVQDQRKEGFYAVQAVKPPETHVLVILGYMNKV